MLRLKILQNNNLLFFRSCCLRKYFKNVALLLIHNQQRDRHRVRTDRFHSTAVDLLSKSKRTSFSKLACRERISLVRKAKDRNGNSFYVALGLICATLRASEQGIYKQEMVLFHFHTMVFDLRIIHQ